MQYAFDILYETIVVASGNDGRVGPSEVYQSLVKDGVEGITGYHVRKTFKELRQCGILKFWGNHYTLNYDGLLGGIAQAATDYHNRVVAS